MIELVRDLMVINALAKFENDPWKIIDVRVLTGLVCPAARPFGVRKYPGALKGCGVKTQNENWTIIQEASGTSTTPNAIKWTSCNARNPPAV